ncbi:cytochrome P450 [Singulisphaera sp. Ch08]|uniref:Cytochrome P450 n=1 Tax=Singulisphaera sp. Ch08 TaxID=3120278 RepID=A0AAU7CDG7_9BACT
MQSRTFDLNTQAYKRNPYPTLARMVAQGPVVRVRFPWIGKLWMATSYEAASELLRDRERFVREPRSAGMPQRANLPWWFPRSMQPMAEVMINRDEPDHRRLRGLVEQAFLRRGVEQLRPRFDAIMRQLLDELEAKFRRDGHPIDLVAGLARPFPLAVICELLGLPSEDRPMFVKLAGAFSGSPSLFVLFRILGAIKSINAYIREQIRLCRANPRQGLISELIAAKQEDDRLTEDEMVAMVILLLLAGHMTTVHLIGAGIYTLLTHPAQKQSLLTDWSLVYSTVDELLRYLSPVQMTKPMMPAHDLEWYGQRLKRGDKIVALLAAANVDPQKFEDPDRFDIHRSPNPHMAFGAGIHVCLGLRLARAEAEIALEQLLTRFPKLELAIPPSQVKWSRQPGTRGMEALPVRLL